MKRRAWILLTVIFILCPALYGCREKQKQDSALPAYIVISEELDVNPDKTTDKVSEILDHSEDKK